MAVGYVIANQSIRAEQLNALATDLDGALRCLFGGHSWLVYEFNSASVFPEGKRFYFGDSGSWKILTGGTVYDHSTYTTAAAGLSVVAVDADLELAWCEELTWTLDDSLEAHERYEDTPKGKRWLYLANRDATTKILSHRERHRRLDVAEIIVEAWDGTIFEWRDDWDKYHFLRFHNLDPSPLRVRLPNGYQFTIQPFGVQAARRTYPVGDNWDISLRYLWKAQSGDLLILDGVRENNVASLICYHNILDLSFGDDLKPCATPAWHFDPRVIWNGTTLFPLSADRRLPEYFYRLGNFVSIQKADSATRPLAVTSAPPSWERLESPLGWAGVRSSFPGGFFTIDKSSTAMSGETDCLGTETLIFPKSPVTLPYGPDALSVATITAPGCLINSTEISSTYYTDPFTPVSVSAFYDAPTGQTPGWSNSGTGAWEKLSVHGNMTALDAAEATDKPTVAWSSDGWRLVAHGAVRFPASLCFVPDSIAGVSQVANATITNEYIEMPFGVDLFSRTSWHITTARQGRKLSDYVGYYDVGENVTYSGHPDATGEDGLADGMDFEESRGKPDDSVVKRLEYVDPPQDTRTLPVIPLDDSADRIVENIGVKDWYPANRTDLIAGTLSLADKLRVVRMPIMREHYNHVAQRLNSLVAITPFQFEHAIWWGEFADGSEPSWTNITYSPGVQPLPQDQNQPAGYYCAVLSSGARHVDIGGMPHNSVSVGGSTTRYLTIATVAHAAQRLGFRFVFERLETPRRAIAADLPIPGGKQWWPDDDFTEDWRDYRTDGFLLCSFATYTGYGLVPPPAYPTETDVAPVARWERYRRDPSQVPSGWRLADESRLLAVPRTIIQYEDATLADNPTSWPGSAAVHEVVDPPADTARFWAADRFPAGEDITAASIAALHDVTLADSRMAYDVRLVSRMVYRRR